MTVPAADTASLPPLYALPHAGGSALGAFPGWREALADLVRLEPLELPGHGRRVGEPFCETLRAAAADCAERIARTAGGAPFALLGHSIGGLLAYELDALLHDRGGPAPAAVVIAGTPAPRPGPAAEAMLHTLSDDRFLAAVGELGGLPEAVLAHPEARTFHAELLRADYRLHERWAPADPPHRVGAPLLVLLAADDPLTRMDDAQRWRRFAARTLTTRIVPGAAHFFPVDRREETLAAVRAFLARVAWEPHRAAARNSASAAAIASPCIKPTVASGPSAGSSSAAISMPSPNPPPSPAAESANRSPRRSSPTA